MIRTFYAPQQILCVRSWLDIRRLLARAPRRTSPNLVRLTPDFQGQTHKIGAVSPHGEISGTLH
jgi:hypothetical protein